MTPGARVAAAIGILDQIMAGAAAEQALASWSRRSRFAGSKDRAAVRDHVFDALRNLQGFQALAGETDWPPSGRALMIGAVRAGGGDPAALFSGIGHAPAPLSPVEAGQGGCAEGIWNLPGWLREEFVSALGPERAARQAELLAQRAPVTLRANVAREALRRRLEGEGFELRDNPLSPQALTVTGSARGLTATAAYRAGLFEMQDAASQAVIDALDLPDAGRILDFCAGGGGKALAMAARTQARITAHDADPGRMTDLPRRAARAGVEIAIERDRSALPRAGFDLVLLDVPCSGSGSWRRAPEARWRLTRERLDALVTEQQAVLAAGQGFVAPGGGLAYVTCSILAVENCAQSSWFVANFPGWRVAQQRTWPVSDQGDGFFLTVFTRSPAIDTRP